MSGAAEDIEENFYLKHRDCEPTPQSTHSALQRDGDGSEMLWYAFEERVVFEHLLPRAVKS